MPKTAVPIDPPLEIAIAAESMATTVLLIGEWLLKQQQQLTQQKRKLEEKQQLIGDFQKINRPGLNELN